MIKMKQNGVVCKPGQALLFFIIRFEYLISGPKSYRDFRETGPRSENRWENDIFWSEKGPGFRELDGAPPPSKGAVIIFHYIT